MVNDNHVDNNLKEILVYVYYGLIVNSRSKTDVHYLRIYLQSSFLLFIKKKSKDMLSPKEQNVVYSLNILFKGELVLYYLSCLRLISQLTPIMRIFLEQYKRMFINDITQIADSPHGVYPVCQCPFYDTPGINEFSSSMQESHKNCPLLV